MDGTDARPRHRPMGAPAKFICRAGRFDLVTTFGGKYLRLVDHEGRTYSPNIALWPSNRYELTEDEIAIVRAVLALL